MIKKRLVNNEHEPVDRCIDVSHGDSDCRIVYDNSLEELPRLDSQRFSEMSAKPLH